MLYSEMSLTKCLNPNDEKLYWKIQNKTYIKDGGFYFDGTITNDIQ